MTILSGPHASAAVNQSSFAEPRRTAARWAEGKPEARPQGGVERWPRESRKAQSRVGIEFRRELAAGAGGNFRQQMVRVTERRLPWSRRTRPGWGLSDTILIRSRRARSCSGLPSGVSPTLQRLSEVELRQQKVQGSCAVLCIPLQVRFCGMIIKIETESLPHLIASNPHRVDVYSLHYAPRQNLYGVSIHSFTNRANGIALAIRVTS
jgi:hypothetical protein